MKTHFRDAADQNYQVFEIEKTPKQTAIGVPTTYFITLDGCVWRRDLDYNDVEELIERIALP
jgi:hypothetical protein